MKIRRSDSFKKDFKKLPENIQNKIIKQLSFLLENPRHPSLRLKKMEDPRDIWEVRVTKGYRFTFQFQGEIYYLRRAGTHDILKTP